MNAANLELYKAKVFAMRGEMNDKINVREDLCERASVLRLWWRF